MTLLTIVALALGAVSARAPSPVGLDPLEEEWRWAELGRESGLPEGLVSQLVETADGEMWAVVGDVLVVFDGYGWEVVPTEAGRIFSVERARAEGVLVAAALGLFRVTREGQEPVATDVGGIVYAGTLGDGEIVVGAQPRRLTLYRDGGATELPFPDRSSSGMGSPALLSSGGRLWSPSLSGLHEWVGGAWVERAPFNVDKACADGERALVAVANDRERQGLWSLGDGPPEPLFVGFGALVSAIAAAAGTAIVVFDSGAVEVRRGGVWREIHAPGIPLGSARVVRLQDNGDLWIATSGSVYLHRASSRRWRQDREVGAQINAIAQRRDGSIWIGTSEGLSVRDRAGELSHIDRILDTPLDVVTGLAEDAAGNFWVSSGYQFPGAFRHDGSEWRHFGASDGLLADRVHAIRLDRSGRPWFLGLAGTGDGSSPLPEPGAFVFEGGGFRRVGVDEGLLDGRVFAFLDGSDGAMWFGTQKGLSRLRDGAWTTWSMTPGQLHGSKVFALAQAGDGRVCFGHQYTAGGLGCIDADGTITYLTTADGLPSDRVWNVVAGNDGDLWVATESGVARVKGDSVRVLDRPTGLGHQRAWPLLVSPDELLVGTLGGGLYALRLDEILGGRPPRVSIFEPALRGGTTELEWHALAPRGEISPSRVETRYRLDEEPWSRWSRVREASFHHLQPGTHRLSVEAASLLEPTATVTREFVIPTPLYRHPAVIGLYVLWLVGMVAVAVVAMRRRHLQTRKLRRSEERFRALIENASDAITVIDRRGTVLFQSPSAERMIGREANAMVGRSLLEVVLPEDLERARQLGTSPQGGPQNFRVLHADGSVRVVEVVARPLPYDGEGAVVLNSRDATERVRIGEERDLLAAKLRRKERLESLGLMAGGVAHDFNNLLAVIVGHADLAALGIDRGARASHDIAQIQLAARRAADLTAQLLAYTGQRSPATTLFDCAALVRETASLLAVSLSRGVRILCEVVPDVPAVNADRGQIQQVVMNLLTNAAEAAPTGADVRVQVKPGRWGDASGRVIDGPDAATAVVLVIVIDHGRGMDEATAERMFDPFFTTKFTGRGLGLAAVLGIVRAHGGGIAVDTAPDVGTTVTFGLPASARAMQVESPLAPTFDAVIPAGSRVLVVDDDDAVRDVVIAMLARCGIGAVAAHDGLEALEVFTRERGITAAIVDLTMPRMTGIELLRALRERGVKLPVLLMTGLDAEAETEAATRGEPHVAVLQKPFRATALLEKLAAVSARMTHWDPTACPPHRPG